MGDESNSETITVSLTRKEWMLARNQLRNQADDWRRSASRSSWDMADKVDRLAGQIDNMLFAQDHAKKETPS